MLLLIELFTLIITSLLCYDIYLRYSRFGILINKLPGPPTVPVLGNLLTFFKVNIEELSQYTKKNIDLYYPIYRLWFFFKPTIIIVNPEDAEILLSSTKHINKGRVYDWLKPWLRNGLLMSTGSKWQNRRKILTSAFHFHILQKYMQVFIEHGDKFVKHLKDNKNEKEIELVPFWATFTLSSICEAAMGTSLDVIEPEIVNKYREAVMFMGELTVYRFFRPWLLNDFIFSNFSTVGWQMKKHLKVLHDFSGKIIKERMEFHKQTDGKYLSEFSSLNNENDKTYRIRAKQMAMLDLLIAAHRDGLIDEEGIKEEVDTFVFEGHDTTAMALCFTIQLLAEHKDAQEKARNEINQIWKFDTKIDIILLNRLTFLDQVIKESLRLFPVVPQILRHINEDIQLKNYKIPAGSSLDIYKFAIHRDPNYWPDPDKFDPDRFLPEKIIKRHPFSFIPFSGGPRNCIGQKFAMMELKIFCMYALKHFRLETSIKHNELDRKIDLVYRTIQNLKVKFVPLND